MGIGSIVWGLATLALPLATTAVGFFLWRALFGFGHCMMIPAGAVSIRDWVGSHQRALAVGLIFSGGTIGGGWVGDFLIRSGVRKNSARKGMIAGGLMGATVFVVAAAFTTQTWLAVTLLTLCMGSLRMTTASSNSLSIDLAPKNALASLASIQSIGGNVGGLMAPILTGYILGATGSFVGALVFAGGMATFSACSMLFLVGRIGEEGDRMVLRS